MNKSAASHVAVGIVSIILGPIIVEFLRPGFPGLYRFFENFGTGISDLINNILGIHTDPVVFTSLFVVIVIGTVWGVAYGIARHRTNDR